MKMRTSNARDERSPLIAHGGVDGGGDRPTTFAAIGRRTKMMLGATAVVLCGGAALASSADARARIGDWIPKNGTANKLSSFFICSTKIMIINQKLGMIDH